MSSKKKKKKTQTAPKAAKRTTAPKARRAAAPKKRASVKAKPAAKATKAAAKSAKPAKKVAAAKPAKKPITKIVAKAKAKAKAKAPEIKRRDGAGHLDPKYAADLRARSRAKSKDDNRAFLGGHSRSADSLTEELGEEFVETVTSGEDEGAEVRDQRVTEEVGGPFTVTSGGTEFAGGTDRSNPKSATREPFPRS